jgi:hypothetical protein
MLGSLDLMHNGVMPPFAGQKPELETLTAFLAEIPSTAAGVEDFSDGSLVFESYCAPCHRAKPWDTVLNRLRDLDWDTADRALQDLKGMFVRMPNIQMESQERIALIRWIKNSEAAGH